MRNGIHILLNPAAGSGKAAKAKEHLVRLIKDRLHESFEFDETTAPGDAVRIARKAAENGARLLIVVGGDGTINEAVNGLLSAGKSAGFRCEIGVLDCGSGAGFAQSMGLPSDFPGQLDVICRNTARSVDIGHVTFDDERGGLGQRYFVNECQTGISAAIVSRVGAKHKRLGGTLAFGVATLFELFHFRAATMRTRLDGNDPETQNLLGVVIGNGRYCAGGMQLTPRASLSDRRFDVLRIGEMNLLQRLANFGKVYSGKHVLSPHFVMDWTERMEINSMPPVRIELDGELVGKTPCTIRLVPGALNVKCSGRQPCFA